MAPGLSFGDGDVVGVQLFLVALSRRFLASSASAGQEVYRRRQRDQSLAQAWDEAVSEAVDALESELWRRAVDGVEQPVYYKGEVVGTMQECSDKLAMFLLKGLMPERYGLTVGDVQNRARGLVQAAE